MHNQPKVNLSGIEFLCLSIQSNPGRCQRWHLRRLHRYKTGKDCPGKGNRGSEYFRSPSYRNVLWCNANKENVRYDGHKWKSNRSYMYITEKGNIKANIAREKIGLNNSRGEK